MKQTSPVKTDHKYAKHREAEPLSSTARIAYLIVAHNHLCQLVKLVNALDSPNACFIIHIDKKARGYREFIDDPSSLSLLGNERVSFLEPRQVVRWGAYSVTNVCLCALKEALKIPGVVRFKSLSGTDFPIRPTMEIEGILLRDVKTIFLKGARPRNWRVRARTEQYWFDDTFRNHRLAHYFARGQRLLGINRKHPHGVPVFKGGAWWCLNRGAVSYVLEFLESRPDVERFFRRSSIADESLIPSILQTSPLWKDVVHDSQVFTRFKPGASNPDELESTDLPEALSSGKLFARKFNTGKNPGILEIVDDLRHSLS